MAQKSSGQKISISEPKPEVKKEEDVVKKVEEQKVRPGSFAELISK